MNSKDRYSLCPPIPGGNQFWEINDMEQMFAVVAISASLPHAEREARRLYAMLTEEQ